MTHTTSLSRSLRFAHRHTPLSATQCARARGLPHASEFISRERDTMCPETALRASVRLPSKAHPRPTNETIEAHICMAGGRACHAALLDSVAKGLDRRRHACLHALLTTRSRRQRTRLVAAAAVAVLAQKEGARCSVSSPPAAPPPHAPRRAAPPARGAPPRCSLGPWSVLS